MQLLKMQTQSPLVQARNFAVMTGVQAGLSLAIKHARGGVEDVRGACVPSAPVPHANHADIALQSRTHTTLTLRDMELRDA